MGSMMTQMSRGEIHAVLFHLGHNFWCDWYDGVPGPDVPRPPDVKLRCRDELWRKATSHAAEKGCNMVVVDVGEGLVYPSHPEIAIEGSWSAEKMRGEVQRLREIGLEPIPKLNFSMTHNGWLGKWRHQASTPEYYKTCEELLADVYEIFDHPRFIHIGGDEEREDMQRGYHFQKIIARKGDLWWHDFLHIVRTVEKLGARAWAWSDACWHDPEGFIRRCPKSVVLSNWFYDEWNGGFDPTTNGTVDLPRLKAFWLLDEAGFDQIPCGTTWAAPKRLEERGNGDDVISGIVHVGRTALDPSRCMGFMMASWKPFESEEMLERINHATDLLADAVVTDKTLLFGEGFRLGCNYWASHAGTEMWRQWDAESVEKDFAVLEAHGMDTVRVFPIWRDFQPIVQIRKHGGSPCEIAWKDERPLPNFAGVDYEMLDRFRVLCDIADCHHIKLVVGLITGFMSSRNYMPPALEGRSPINDPECVKWEVRFVRQFVNSLKNHSAIVAWDLGNECNVMGADSEANAWRWLDEIGAAIRLADPARPVVSGMHGCSANRESAWNLSDQGELMDVLTTHPYPLWTPDCNRERFDSLRDEAHAAAESILYQGLSGKPCLVEEAGSMGPTVVSEERAAAAMRVALFNCWAEGLPGYLWWCAFNQDKLDFAPYDWTYIERELGLFKADRSPKPTAKAMSAFSAFLKKLPFVNLPPAKKAAVCLLSNRADVWRSAFGAYLLSRQAGFGISFASAESPFPESAFYILPAMPGYNAYSGRAWHRLLDKVRAGATAFISLGCDGGHSEFVEATGLETLDHHVQNVSYSFVFADRPGERIHAADSYVRENIVRTAEVLAADENGSPVVSVNKLGNGKVVYCNFPIETMGVVSGGCWTGDKLNPLYRVYEAAAREAGVGAFVGKSVPGVGMSEHRLPDGRAVVVAINYEPEAVKCSVNVKCSVTKVLRGAFVDGMLEIPANDAAVLLTI